MQVTVRCLLWTATAMIGLFANGAWGQRIDPENNDHHYLTAGGAARLTGVYVHYSDDAAAMPAGQDGMTFTVLRLLLNGDFGKYVGLEFNGYGESAGMPGSEQKGGDNAFSLAGRGSVYRVSWLDFHSDNEASASFRAVVDRLNIHFQGRRIRLVLGRFPVNYQVSRMFAVNDFFAPFSVLAINKLYKPGVDGAQLSLSPGALSSLELTGLLGRDGVPRALLLRAQTVWRNTDFALLGGRLAERYVVGASVEGEVGPITLYGDGQLNIPDQIAGSSSLPQKDKVDVALAVGAETLFPWRNATLGLETVYFSAGERPDGYVTRLFTLHPEQIPLLGRHYLGLSAGLELIPILRLGLTGHMNLLDRSGTAGTMLLYNVADEIDVVAGGYLPWGKKSEWNDRAPGGIDPGSEYGNAGATLYAEARYFF